MYTYDIPLIEDGFESGFGRPKTRFPKAPRPLAGWCGGAEPLHAAPTPSHHLPPQKPKRRQWCPFPGQVASFDRCHRIMWHGLFGADQPIGVGAHLLVAPVAVIQGCGAGTENLGHTAFAPHGCHNGPERILIPATDWNKRHHARISAKSRGWGSSA
jgi:hypothetical protein